MSFFISSLIVYLQHNVEEYPQEWASRKKGIYPPWNAGSFCILQLAFTLVITKSYINRVNWIIRRQNNLCLHIYIYIYQGVYLLILIRRTLIKSKSGWRCTSIEMLHRSIPLGSKLNSSITVLWLGRLPWCNYTDIIGTALV